MRLKSLAIRSFGILILLASSCGAIGRVAINEVAWAGNVSDHTAEWIELVNTGDVPVDLAGWRLTSSDGAPDIVLQGVLPPATKDVPASGLYLLEREAESAVPSRPADLIYAGALSDNGETLSLYDADGRLVDTANAGREAGDGWFAGAAWAGGVAPRSMERVDPTSPDAPDNWASAACEPGSPSSGLYCGTPGAANSVRYARPIAGIKILPAAPGPREVVLFEALAAPSEGVRILSYAWTFGDGGTGDGQTASHVFETVGDYAVVLTVFDEWGASSQRTQTVSVRIPTPPRADFSVIRHVGRTWRSGTPIEFLDESGEGSAAIVERLWSFGDGATADEPRPSHTFESAGTYTICLSLTDAEGAGSERCQAIVVASRVPTAAFTVESGIHSDGEPVLFDAAGSTDPDGEIASYLWDLDGDGEPDRVVVEPLLEHSFASGGYFALCLIVEDDGGDRSAPVCGSLYVNAGPAATFTLSTFEPDENEAILFQDLSHDPDGTILQRRWDFGDGETAVQTSPTHAYRKSGPYTIVLTVTDDQSASRSASATIDVANLPPIASIASDLREAPTDAPISFDASASTDPSPEGRIVGYKWDLDGDGAFDRETTSPTLSECYEEDGIYEVTVRVTDDVGATSDSPPVSVTILNRPPSVVGVTWDSEPPLDGVEVSFSAQVEDPDGDVASWTWTFDDEGSSRDAEAVHVFLQNRTYRVTLVVEDDDGDASEPLICEVPVENASPVAAFRHESLGSGRVAFNASASRDPSPEGEIIHYAWDFGDGTSCPDDPSACGTGSQTNPEHTFPGPGVYDVTLVVIDDDGGIGQSTQSVTID